jgi:hypothetical protein
MIFLQTLLENQCSWIPSIVSKYSLIHSSQRVEGFFGNFKDAQQHQCQTLSEMFSTLHNRYRNLLQHSLRWPRDQISEKILCKSDSKKVGGFALKTIKSEVEALMSNLSDEENWSDKIANSSDNCCDTRQQYGLPCIHLLNERARMSSIPLISLNDIPLRWLFYLSDRVRVDEKHVEVNQNPSTEKKLTFGDYQAIFQPVFETALRNEEVALLLQEFMEKYDALKQRLIGDRYGIQDPLVLKQTGRKKTKMSTNSPLSRSKKKI